MERDFESGRPAARLPPIQGKIVAAHSLLDNKLLNVHSMDGGIWDLLRHLDDSTASLCRPAPNLTTSRKT